MGLGPPVCTACKVYMQCNQTDPFWTCPKCDQNGHTGRDVGHLFCLDRDVLDEYDKNSLEFFPWKAGRRPTKETWPFNQKTPEPPPKSLTYRTKPFPKWHALAGGGGYVASTLLGDLLVTAGRDAWHWRPDGCDGTEVATAEDGKVAAEAWYTRQLLTALEKVE